MKLLEKKIEDQRFLELIRKALNAGYLIGKVAHTDIAGTPQGSIISPILANIHLHELDKFVEGLKDEYDHKGPKKQRRSSEIQRFTYLISKAKLIEDPVSSQKEVHRLRVAARKVKSNAVGIHSHKLMYVRYADDWIVAINGTRNKAQECLERIKKFCLEELGLTVSEEKTKITNSYTDQILFLGVNIRHSLIQTVSRHRGVLRRNPKALLLTAPMNRIKAKFKSVGFIREGKSQTRVT